MTGRKRHIVVDTMGLLLAVVVHPASIQDRIDLFIQVPRLVGIGTGLAKLVWGNSLLSGDGCILEPLWVR